MTITYKVKMFVITMLFVFGGAMIASQTTPAYYGVGLSCLGGVLLSVWFEEKKR